MQSIANPFAALTHEIHVSGRLTLLRSPRGTCSDWTCVAVLTPDPVWHRRLDANTFLWLRSAVERAIESGKLSSEFADAESRLDWIAQVGLEHGSFTADEIETHCRAPEWFTFNAGLPSWVDEIRPDFLPPLVKSHDRR